MDADSEKPGSLANDKAATIQLQQSPQERIQHQICQILTLSHDTRNVGFMCNVPILEIVHYLKNLKSLVPKACKCPIDH